MPTTKTATWNERLKRLEIRSKENFLRINFAGIMMAAEKNEIKTADHLVDHLVG